MSESAAAGLGMDIEAEITDEIQFGLLEDIKAVLTAAGITAPIYTGWQPPSPDTCITLSEYAGLPPLTMIGVETPGLQIRVRQATGDYDYQKCRTVAINVFHALHDKTNFRQGKTDYIQIKARQSPFFAGRDGNNRPEFLINFLVVKVRN